MNNSTKSEPSPMKKISKLDLHIYAILFIAVIIAIPLNEPLFAGHLGIIATFVVSWMHKGLPRKRRLFPAIFLMSGAPLYLIGAVLGYALFTDQIESARTARASLDDRKDQVEEFVGDFKANADAGLVGSLVHSLKPVHTDWGPASVGIFNFMMGSANTFIPNELGPDPIIPIATISDASKMVMLIDLKEQASQAESIASGSDERLPLFSNPEIGEISRPVVYSCLLNGDDELIRFSALEAGLINLDLTKDPIFAPIRDLCERRGAENIHHGGDKWEAMVAKTRLNHDQEDNVIPE